ncbi:alcohol dehydrogenase catalytic domain-containing protein [bacterium]|nr:alcohol dehydrogenase catalytic domain-containing protein [bacterium]
MTAPGRITIGETAQPAPGKGEVLLHVRRIGVCGSDIHVWHGCHPFTSYPVVQGHEFSAVVAAIGPGVKGIPVGAKVTALPQETCGTCNACRRGDYHICYNLKVQGFQAPGVAQDYFVMPADKIVLLPDDFTFEQGAFVEPCSVAVHATGRAGSLEGRNIVVIGAGTIGNLVSQCASARGGTVMTADISDYRLDIARQCGITHTWNTAKEPLDAAVKRAFGDAGFDAAFECAGAEQPINSVIDQISKGGTIVQVGLYGAVPRVNLSMVGEHELTIIGSLMYRRPDYEQAVAWLAAKRIVVGPLDSIHFPFARYTEAYQYIDANREKCLKVFIDVND